MFNNRTALAFISFIACTLAFSGCIESKQSIAVDNDGMAYMNFSVYADKSQAGTEVSQFAWEVEQLVPQLNTEYEIRNYTYKQDYTEYIVYEWRAKKKIPVTDIKGVTWASKNGIYDFRMNIEPIFNMADLTESNRKDAVMEIQLIMSRTVDIANTPYVDGSTAKWVITKELLTKPNILKAVTK